MVLKRRGGLRRILLLLTSQRLRLFLGHALYREKSTSEKGAESEAIVSDHEASGDEEEVEKLEVGGS